MKKVYVYADFDWLKEIELIGELGYESLRGSDSYSFSFHDDWLKKHGDLFLSEDLNNYPGMQYALIICGFRKYISIFIQNLACISISLIMVNPKWEKKEI